MPMPTPTPRTIPFFGTTALGELADRGDVQGLPGGGDRPPRQAQGRGRALDVAGVRAVVPMS